MKTTLTAMAALMISFSPLAAQTHSQASATSFIAQQQPSEVLGTDFIWTPVLTKDGQRIGRIENLVFDQTGHIELAVIGIGGFLGIGEKEVAVPFDTLKSEVRDNKPMLIIDATREQLTAAPAYKTLNDQAFNKRMADWRTKAAESWAAVKERAGKAYEEAKTRINEPSTPAEQPK